MYGMHRTENRKIAGELLCGEQKVRMNSSGIGFDREGPVKATLYGLIEAIQSL
jgi:hypothetical protein